MANDLTQPGSAPENAVEFKAKTPIEIAAGVLAGKIVNPDSRLSEEQVAEVLTDFQEHIYLGIAGRLRATAGIITERDPILGRSQEAVTIADAISLVAASLESMVRTDKRPIVRSYERSIGERILAVRRDNPLE